MKNYETCKGCHGEYHPDGLRGGVCFMCLREPVEDRPMSAVERVMWAGVLIALLIAAVMLSFGKEPEPTPAPAKFIPLTGYYDYQQFAEANK